MDVLLLQYRSVVGSNRLIRSSVTANRTQVPPVAGAVIARGKSGGRQGRWPSFVEYESYGGACCIIADEGFDSWETLLDIQEQDLVELNVKLGHRRKLQRAIADFRGIPYERLLASPTRENQSDISKLTDGKQGEPHAPDSAEGPHAEGSQSKAGASAIPAETKRKYRRHPKQDENAPEKPPSAYVLFSNKVREDVKPENLSFTEIAKLVGERWQKLNPTQKEPYEAQAQALKESYHLQLSTYKKTDSFKEYAQYLADFKARQSRTSETKRPKLDPQSSGGSASVTSQDLPEAIASVPSHVRGGSIGSVSNASLTGPLPSPIALTSTGSLPNIPSSGVTPATGGPRPGSPTSAVYGRDRRRLGQLSTQSSLSDDSIPVRSENHDPLSRTATLSLSTPPAVTPPLPPKIPNPARSEQSISSESISRQGVRPPSQPHFLSSPHGAGVTLPSATVAAESWRERASGMQRSTPTPTIQHNVYSAPTPLPSIINRDRLPTLTRAQAQRTLPPLPQPPISTIAVAHPGHPAQHVSLSVSQGNLPSPSIVGRHENEAANALAELAHRSGNDYPPHRDDGWH